MSTVGAPLFRAIATHTRTTQTGLDVDARISHMLHKITKSSGREGDRDLPSLNTVFAIGQRVRVTTNDGTQIGIYNGAVGTVHSFGFMHPPTIATMNPIGSGPTLALQNRSPTVIYVQMDAMAYEPPVPNSPPRQISCSTDVDRLIPFTPIKSFTDIKLFGTSYGRYQYPLEPATATTCHKSQGVTALHGIVIDMPSNSTTMALAYVALSRAKTISLDPITRQSTVVLLKPLLRKHFIIHETYGTDIRSEYDRLRSLSNVW